MIYQISSGQGPAECELGAAKFLEYLARNYPITVLETSRGYHEGTFRVESGVRAIYLPTGQAVECTEERSQYANKQKAIARLREITRQRNQTKQAAVKNADWRCHTSLERGNAGAVFVGMEFKKK